MPPKIEYSLDGSTLTYSSTTTGTSPLYVPYATNTITISTPAGPDPIVTSSDLKDTKEKIEEQLEKNDKHVDDLEADMEYFNDKLIEHWASISKHEVTLTDITPKILDATSKIEFLNNYINYLEGRLMHVETTLNNILQKINVEKT